MLRRNIADSFVNLGRRNQNLLARQLDFITSSNGSRPTRRARQPSASTTWPPACAQRVVAGAGGRAAAQWARPVPLTDVVRSALGEVEDYQRVAVRSVEQVTVIGPPPPTSPT